MGDTALRVENLTKEYRLGTIGYGTLREDMQSWWARVRGKEDPNSLVTARHTAESERKHFLALDDLSFEVKKGERLGIIGKNGAGKSTLLKILSRITSPTKGRILLNGKVGSLLEVGTGFHQELTGRENIYLNGAILGMKKWEINKKFDEIVDFAGIERFIDTPVKRYSSGMFVRLGFAVAAHLEPDILIVDEVLAVGDAEFQKKAIGKMESVSQDDGRTVLFVSHNMGVIRQLCTKAIFLHSGSIKMNDETSLVIDNYLRDSDSDAETAEKYFEIDESKDFQLVSAQLLTIRDEISMNFSCDEPILIELLINTKKILSGYFGYMQISKKDGTPVLISDSNDITKNTFDNLKPGLNKIRLNLPERTLGPGSYYLYFNFTDASGNNIDSPGTVCSFNLQDILTERGNKRKGYFSTLIPWKILL